MPILSTSLLLIIGCAPEPEAAPDTTVFARISPIEARTINLKAPGFIEPLNPDQGGDSLLLEVDYQITAALPALNDLSIQVGDRLRFTAPLMNRPQLTARVSNVRKVNDEIQIVARFRYFARTLDYMHSTIEVLGHPQRVYEVPIAALANPTGAGAHVFTVSEDGIARKVFVQIISSEVGNSEILISGDLTNAENVAVTSIDRILEGRQLRIIK